MFLYSCYTPKIVRDFKAKHKGHPEIQQVIPEKIHTCKKILHSKKKLKHKDKIGDYKNN
jgi:hypothetical protein